MANGSLSSGQRLRCVRHLALILGFVAPTVGKMNSALKALIEASQKAGMPSEEREAQRRSFAYGNTHFENPLITREMVDRAAESLSTSAGGSDDGAE